MNSLWWPPAAANMKSRGTVERHYRRMRSAGLLFRLHVSSSPPRFTTSTVCCTAASVFKPDQHRSSGNRFLEASIIDSVGPTAARDGGSTSEGGINISRDRSAPMGGAESISPAQHGGSLPPWPLFSGQTAVQIHRPFDPRSTDCKLNWLT